MEQFCSSEKKYNRSDFDLLYSLSMSIVMHKSVEKTGFFKKDNRVHFCKIETSIKLYNGYVGAASSQADTVLL